MVIREHSQVVLTGHLPDLGLEPGAFGASFTSMPWARRMRSNSWTRTQARLASKQSWRKIYAKHLTACRRRPEIEPRRRQLSEPLFGTR